MDFLTKGEGGASIFLHERVQILLVFFSQEKSKCYWKPAFSEGDD